MKEYHNKVYNPKMTTLETVLKDIPSYMFFEKVVYTSPYESVAVFSYTQSKPCQEILQ